MPHVIERATTGRATCRGCGGAIAKDTLRIGEAGPNLYAEKDDTESLHWHHPGCAAFRRPGAFLQAVEGSDLTLPDRDALVAVAAEGVAHHRLPRIDRAERASSGRPAGFVHAPCAATYFETANLLDRLRHFTPELASTDLAALARDLAGGPPPASAPAQP